MSAARGPVGSLAIVLHSHMPYVEGFGTYPFGEEWLFDALARSYLSVIGLAERISVSVTPVLADQLEAPGVAERFQTFLREFRLAACEADADDVEPALRGACLAEAKRYREGLERLRELDGALLEIFAGPAREGRIELLASSATHAVMPLVATAAGRRLQLDAGLRSHSRRFGAAAGLWLPECAYAPGLDRLLAEFGIRHFCTDQSGYEDPLDALAPIASPGGPIALTIDWEAVEWLWSLGGYPSHRSYSDFHRKTMRGARPWAIGGEPYDPAAGEATARRQAEEFVAAIAARLERYRQQRHRPGLVTFAIDTELLGHWWWEGPTWLEQVLASAAGHGIELLTLSQAVERHQPERRPLRRSSWGELKDLSTWDSPPVADLAWAARRCELRLLRALGEGLLRPAAERAARELLALQASDWAFLDSRRQAGDYPYQRHTGHARAMLEAIDSAEPPDPRLRALAPDLSLTPLLRP